MSDHPPNSPSSARFWALIPSAGTGSRAGVAGPKQYEPLLGQPLILHTLAAFCATPGLEKIAVVLAPHDTFFAGLSLSALSRPVLTAPCGGATRALSVLNGLEFLHAQGAGAHDWVLVHDAARCLITPAQITALMDACADDAVGGLLAHQLADTLKCEADGRVSATLARSDKWLAQTPQMFRLGALRQALAAAGDQVTDESGAMEAQGLRPKLVAGSAQNFKVTYPEDFALAEAVLRARRSALEPVHNTQGTP